MTLTRFSLVGIKFSDMSELEKYRFVLLTYATGVKRGLVLQPKIQSSKFDNPQQLGTHIPGEEESSFRALLNSSDTSYDI